MKPYRYRIGDTFDRQIQGTTHTETETLKIPPKRQGCEWLGSRQQRSTGQSAEEVGTHRRFSGLQISDWRQGWRAPRRGQTSASCQHQSRSLELVRMAATKKAMWCSTPAGTGCMRRNYDAGISAVHGTGAGTHAPLLRRGRRRNAAAVKRRSTNAWVRLTIWRVSDVARNRSTRSTDGEARAKRPCYRQNIQRCSVAWSSWNHLIDQLRTGNVGSCDRGRRAKMRRFTPSA